MVGNAIGANLKSGLDAYKKQNYTTALKHLKPLAVEGHPIAQLQLGTMYELGQGIKQDFSEAVRLYRAAFHQGNDHAQVALGYMYLFGLGVEKDHDMAKTLIFPAAEKGIRRAQYLAGTMYKFQLGGLGRGSEDYYDGVLKWYYPAAKKGVSDAQYFLGRMYHEGWGVKKHPKVAISYFSQAAENNHDEAQLILGRIYLNGINGVSKNEEKGVKLLQKAADQGNEDAQSELEDLEPKWYSPYIEPTKEGLRFVGVILILVIIEIIAFLLCFGILNTIKIPPLFNIVTTKIISPFILFPMINAQISLSGSPYLSLFIYLWATLIVLIAFIEYGFSDEPIICQSSATRSVIIILMLIGYQIFGEPSYWVWQHNIYLFLKHTAPGQLLSLVSGILFLWMTIPVLHNWSRNRRAYNVTRYGVAYPRLI